MNIRFPEQFDQNEIEHKAASGITSQQLFWQIDRAIERDGLVLPKDRAEKNSFVRSWLKRNQKRVKVSLLGGLLVLPLAAQAQDADGTVDLSSLENVRSAEVLENGNIRVTLTNGTTMEIAASAAQVLADGSILVSAASAAQIAGAAGAAATVSSGMAIALGGGALALAGASAGGGGSDGPTFLTKNIRVLDGPLENALVFYDANGDNIPQMAEFLGLTDDNGAAEVRYTPTENGSFIVISAPVNAGRADDFGWTQAFIDGDNIAEADLSLVVTRDVVTQNRFQISLAGRDTGASDQIISPISTLISNGADEAALKRALGLPEDLDLATFDYIAGLGSEGAAQDAARKLAAANVSIAKTIEAAVAANQASSTEPLSLSRIKEISESAANDAARVINSLPADTPLEDIAAISSAVISARQLNPDISADDLIARINTAVSGGQSAAEAVATVMQEEVTEGRLTQSQASAVRSTSEAQAQGAQKIAELFADADGNSIGDASFREQLDKIEDDIAGESANAVNQNILGINIPRIVAEFEIGGEDQPDVIKGNLLEGVTFTDSGSGLSSTASVFSVNGTEVPDILTGSGDGLNFVISTADWNTPVRTVSIAGANGVAEFLDLTGVVFPSSQPSPQFNFAMGATAGSAIKTEVTVAAGDTIEFDYQFGSFDYVPWIDYSFFTVKATDGGTAAEQSGIVLRNTAFDGPQDVLNLKGPRPFGEAGRWRLGEELTYSYTFEQAGTFTIGIGATDVGDRIVDSVLYASDVRLNKGGTVQLLSEFDTIGNVQSYGEVNTDISALVVTGKYGLLVVTKGGDYIYQPGGENADPIPEGATVTDDFTFTIRTANGQLASQTISIQLNEFQEAVGPTDPVDPVDPTDPTDPTEPEDFIATNLTTNTQYTTLADAVEQANAGDEISIISGTFDENIVINKAITLSGANAGISAKFVTDGTPDTTAIGNAVSGDADAGGRGAETVLTGKITVASANVVIDGVRMDSDAPLDWDMTALDTGALDGFKLLNSIVTGYTADGSPTFNPDATAARGTYAGETVANDWQISGNLFGGVTSGNSGALYISGVSELDLSDNLFWRPSAGHLYLSSLEDAEIADNFFFHGLHAGGTNFDGLLGEDGGLSVGYGGTGYGYGDDDTGSLAFGRNFWIELKGLNDGVAITGNDGQFNSGGIQLFGEASTAYNFANVTISDNTFRDFVNAAPNGLANGKSGFMGAVSVSIDNGQSEGISITSNTITVAADQIFSVNDLPALIQLQGFLDGVTTVSDNSLSWVAASSAEILDGLQALGVAASTYSNPLIGLRLVGGLDGNVVIQENDFSADNAITLNLRGLEIDGDVPGFGELSAQIEIGGAGDAANSFTGFDVDVFVASLADSFNPNNLLLVGSGAGIVGTVYDGAFKFLKFGDDAENTLMASGAGDILYGGLGDDTLDLSAGGSNIVLLNSIAAENGTDTIVGFVLGDGPGADVIELLPVSGLRGYDWQLVSAGDLIGDDVGFLVYTTALSNLTEIMDPESYIFDGPALGDDPFFILATYDGITVLNRFDTSAATSIEEISVETLAVFTGLGNLSQFTTANLGFFDPYMGV